MDRGPAGSTSSARGRTEVAPSPCIRGPPASGDPLPVRSTPVEDVLAPACGSGPPVRDGPGRTVAERGVARYAVPVRAATASPPGDDVRPPPAAGARPAGRGSAGNGDRVTSPGTTDRITGCHSDRCAGVSRRCGPAAGAGEASDPRVARCEAGASGGAGGTARCAGKAGVTTGCTGEAGVTARCTGEAGVTARCTGEAGVTARCTGEAGGTAGRTGGVGMTARWTNAGSGRAPSPGPLSSEEARAAGGARDIDGGGTDSGAPRPARRTRPESGETRGGTTGGRALSPGAGSAARRSAGAAWTAAAPCPLAAPPGAAPAAASGSRSGEPADRDPACPSAAVASAEPGNGLRCTGRAETTGGVTGPPDVAGVPGGPGSPEPAAPAGVTGPPEVVASPGVAEPPGDAGPPRRPGPPDVAEPAGRVPGVPGPPDRTTGDTGRPPLEDAGSGDSVVGDTGPTDRATGDAASLGGAAAREPEPGSAAC
ncbi:hypothetical protein FHX34_1021296 [Actinoplanes teichomyceticus]|uniref:Uncharacterized protein n=1 Tax=Actinoplanes teichomyceticus TaxID=1867 RepID=A0A561WLJ5_ACTTI|nr:hypothetical protein FHX34_1021296 [Actinoplanes teichomyceticus]